VDQQPENRVAVIVLSYNRPRMLREALDSIKGADEVFLLDDGSDFDVDAVARPFRDRFSKMIVRTKPHLTVDERFSVPRVGRSINQAIRDSTCDAIAYLCDDDLFHPDWIPNIRKHLLEAPAKPHVIYAQWNVFIDGEKPGDRVCDLKPYEMTAGNFAHRKDCPPRCDLWWSENMVVCHDGFFVYWLQQKHPKCEVPKPPGVMAGWRRDHPHNMIRYCWNQKYTEEAKVILSRPFLE
jgi:glycosyltransferase involved in cell wall biosynthesis